uniref:SEA domain-containing protein n=2 Tax=Callorhinchus milii TaxID=7868 RepID=A0A4W3JEM5_CALMI
MKLYAICSFKNISSDQNIARIVLYQKFKNSTNNLSTFGIYSMDNNSLYVNDYHEAPPYITEAPIVIVTQNPNQATKPINFNVTFTLTNLTYKADLENVSSPEYISASSNVVNSLNNLYGKGKLKKTFTKCNLVSFRSAENTNTKVEAVCSFKDKPTVPDVNKVALYNEYRDNTNQITALGSYSLNSNSLYVNGYHPLQTTRAPTTTTVPPVIPGIQDGDLTFEVLFTVINRNYTEALNNPDSPEYQALSNNVTRMLSRLYQNSSLKDSYRICEVTGLRLGSIVVSCNCYFNPKANLEPVLSKDVQSIFDVGTNGTELLEGTYQLRPNSLVVEPKPPVSSGKTEIPYWAIILIVLAILIALFLLFLIILLLIFCLKKNKSGSYNIMQDPLGTYFAHKKYY